MTLWLLTGRHDKGMARMIVRAEDEQRARQIAYECHEIAAFPERWLSRKLVTCVPISTDNDEGVILFDYADVR